MFIISINYNYEEKRDSMVYLKACMQKCTNSNTPTSECYSEIASHQLLTTYIHLVHESPIHVQSNYQTQK